MKLPMMLRTTTQRGLLQTAAARSVPMRSAVLALRASSSIPRSDAKSLIAPCPRPSALPIRTFSSSARSAQPTAKYTASPLSDSEYHKLSNGVLDSLQETFETLLEEADVESLEQAARAKNEGATRGSPAAEWDIECAVSLLSHALGGASEDPMRSRLTL